MKEQDGSEAPHPALVVAPVGSVQAYAYGAVPPVGDTETEAVWPDAIVSTEGEAGPLERAELTVSETTFEACEFEFESRTETLTE